MGEFASNSKANAGLTLGIIGTSLAGLLGANGSNGGGLLGNILGGNNNCCGCPATKENLASAATIAEKDSHIAKLEAERYTDQVSIETYKAAKNDNNALAERLLEKYINPMATEMCDMKAREAALQAKIAGDAENAKLREELMLSKISAAKQEAVLGDKVLEGKIAEVACVANTGLTTLTGVVNCLKQTVDGISTTIVPASAVCPQPVTMNSFVYKNPCATDCGCNG